MKNALLFSFEDLATDKAVKKVSQLFGRAGANVAIAEKDAKVKRSSGITFRDLNITFVDGQQLVMSFKQDGDVFAVKLNSKLVPIKNQDNTPKAVAEVVSLLDSGRAKFQAALAKKAVKLPPTIKTATPKLLTRLTEQRDNLKTAIAEVRAEIERISA